LNLFAQLLIAKFNAIENEHVELLVHSLLYSNITNNNINEHLWFKDVFLAILYEESKKKSKVEMIENSSKFTLWPWWVVNQ